MEQTQPIIITCTFSAPVEKIWAAWSVPEEVKKWWGPKGFTCPVAEIDFAVGGKYLLCMRGDATMPEQFQKDMYSTGTYKEIVSMKRTVVSDSFADEAGNVVPSSYYGMEGMPLATEISMDFADNGDGTTTLTITHNGIPEAMQSDCKDGWGSSLDKLEESIS